MQKTNDINMAGGCQGDAYVQISWRTGLHYANLMLLWFGAKDGA